MIYALGYICIVLCVIVAVQSILIIRLNRVLEQASQDLRLINRELEL